MTRVDYNISDNTKLFVRYNLQRELQRFPVQLWSPQHYAAASLSDHGAGQEPVRLRDGFADARFQPER